MAKGAKMAVSVVTRHGFVYTMKGGENQAVGFPNARAALPKWYNRPYHQGFDKSMRIS